MKSNIVFYLLSLCIFTLGFAWEESAVAQDNTLGSIFQVPGLHGLHRPHWSRGQKSHIVIRLRYTDLDRDLDTNGEFSEAAIEMALTNINSFYIRNSYGNVSFPLEMVTIVPQIISTTSDNNGSIYLNEMESLGYNPDDYDVLTVIHPARLQSYRALGSPSTEPNKAAIVDMYNILDAAVWAHELGHTLGADHSGFFDPYNKKISVTPWIDGEIDYYGNFLDIMGESNLNYGDFSLYWKTRLGWLNEGTQVQHITTNGDYNIYALDEGVEYDNRIYGIQLTRKESSEDYLLSYRVLPPDDVFDDGLVLQILRVQENTYGDLLSSVLLDASPDSHNGYNEDRIHGALAVGSTYTDIDAGIKLTVLSKHVGAGNNYIRVRIELYDNLYHENRHPVAEDDTAYTEPGQKIEIDVLSNDRDPDYDSLSIEGIDQRKARFKAFQIYNNKLTYIADTNFTGNETIRYYISDGRGGSASGSVTVTVGRLAEDGNRSPEAVNDEVSTPIDQMVTIDVLNNDSDPDGDAPLILYLISETRFGGRAIISDQQIIYTPTYGFSGTDYFRYYIRDGRGGYASATVYITVRGTANQARIEIYNPVNGSTLSGEEATFNWGANGISENVWHLWIGSTLNGYDILNMYMDDRTSYKVTGLPCDGSTIYVRLWYQAGGGWEYVDHQYTAASNCGGGSGSLPEIYNPVNGSTLSGEEATFNWGANGISENVWHLWIGSTLNGYDILNMYMDDRTSYKVTGLPCDGSTIYVRLWYQAGGGWEYVDHQYTAASNCGGGSGSLPEIYNPVNGSTLSGEEATFNWGANGISENVWHLWIGSTLNGYDILNMYMDDRTSYKVTGLPCDGSTIYVRLWYQAGGGWEYVDHQYTAASNCGGGSGSLPEIYNPVNGSTLSGEEETFNWGANGISENVWHLWIGSTLNGYDIFDMNMGSRTSYKVSGLPCDGSQVYVQLFHADNLGGWESENFQYTAASNCGGGSGSLPEIYSPVNGSTLSGEEATFNLRANGNSVTQWLLWIGSTSGSHDLQSANLNNETYYAATGLPCDGSTIYVRLWYQAGGGWEYVDHQYTAASNCGGGSGSLPEIYSPVNGSTLSGEEETFNWGANGISENVWHLWIGSTLNGYDIFDMNMGSRTSYKVSGLPCDGSQVYVQLFHADNLGGWESENFQYTAASGCR